MHANPFQVFKYKTQKTFDSDVNLNHKKFLLTYQYAYVRLYTRKCVVKTCDKLLFKSRTCH